MRTQAGAAAAGVVESGEAAVVDRELLAGVVCTMIERNCRHDCVEVVAKASLPSHLPKVHLHLRYTNSYLRYTNSYLRYTNTYLRYTNTCCTQH